VCRVVREYLSHFELKHQRHAGSACLGHGRPQNEKKKGAVQVEEEEEEEMKMKKEGYRA
jgi:hypothetical protein